MNEKEYLNDGPKGYNNQEYSKTIEPAVMKKYLKDEFDHRYKQGQKWHEKAHHTNSAPNPLKSSFVQQSEPNFGDDAKDIFGMPVDHHWKPESWKIMNEEEYLKDAP